MKKLMIVVALGQVMTVGAVDYTWTGGAGDGNWTSEGNWSGGVPQPGADNRVIFDPGAGVKVSVSGYSFNFYLPRTIVVKSGTVEFAANAYANDQGGSSAAPLVLDIAADATLSAAFRLERSVFMNVRKEGGGSLLLSNVSGYDGGFAPLGTFEVCAGEVSISDTMLCTNLVVRAGASFAGAYRLSGKTYGGVTYPLCCTIESGAAMTSPGGTTVNLGFLEGAGTFDFGGSVGYLNLTLPVEGKSCAFSGTLGSNVKFSVPESALGTFVVGAAATLAGNNVNQIAPDHFAFAAGVGTFSIAAVETLGDGRLCLEDVKGLPVTLLSMPADTFATEGCGDFLLVPSQTASEKKFTGDKLANTGAIGAKEGARLLLGGGAAYPTLDFDFSRAASIRAEGTVVINSSRATVPPISCGAKGVVETYGETSLERMDGIYQLKVYGNTSVEEGYSGRFYQLIMGSGAQLTVNGGEFFNGFRANEYDTLSLVGYRNGTYLGGKDATLVLNGGRLYLRRESSVYNPHFRLQGGVFTANDCYYSPASSSSATTVALDGGEWVLSAVPDSHYNFSMFDEDGAFAVSVGANGARLRSGNVTKGDDSKFYVNRPLVNGTDGVDGGVELYGRGKFHLNYPWTIAGAVKLMDGIVTLNTSADLAATPSWFGTGDMVLGSTVLDLSAVSSSGELRLAPGAGSKVTACGAAAIRLAGSASGGERHVVMGADDASSDSVLSTDRGGVLFLSDDGSALLDGSQSSVKVKGGVANTSGGLASKPVFYAKGVAGEEICFTAYDGEKGFVRFTDEKTSFAAATASDVVSSGYAEELKVPGNATTGVAGVRVGKYGGLSFGSNAVLSLGDGVNPAGIVLSFAAWIGSAGTVDFGTSPGMIVVVDREDDRDSGNVGCTIAGSAGMTFASYPRYGYRRIALNAANTYTGGTKIYAVRVSAGNPGCFGTGRVEVGGGERIGGKVYFGKDGTWANDFKVAGWGLPENSSGAQANGSGALAFNADVVLSGAVELERETRMCACSEGVVAELSGTVSGDRLVAWSGSGRLVLSGSNVYTGGTQIVRSTLVAVRGTSLGSAPVDFDGGVLRFENDLAADFANDLRGVGTVALAGTAPVTFGGDVSAFSGALDLCGTRQVFTALPPFASMTNSSSVVATLALDANLGLVKWTGMTLASNLKLEIGEGTVLDLGGADIEVYRLMGGSAERIVNGTVHQSNPAKGMFLWVR